MNLARLVALAMGLGSDGVLVAGGLDEGVCVVHGMVVSIVMVYAILSGVLYLTLAAIDFLVGLSLVQILAFQTSHHLPWHHLHSFFLPLL